VIRGRPDGRAQVNDTSGDGGGGEQGCWITALIRVVVK